MPLQGFFRDFFVWMERNILWEIEGNKLEVPRELWWCVNPLISSPPPSRRGYALRVRPGSFPLTCILFFALALQLMRSCCQHLEPPGGHGACSVLLRLFCVSPLPFRLLKFTEECSSAYLGSSLLHIYHTEMAAKGRYFLFKSHIFRL